MLGGAPPPEGHTTAREAPDLFLQPAHIFRATPPASYRRGGESQVQPCQTHVPHWGASARLFLLEGARIYAFYMHVACRHLDWQMASAAQIFDQLRPVSSAVEHLTLDN
jgi:hypothetical protein